MLPLQWRPFKEADDGRGVSSTQLCCDIGKGQIQLAPELFVMGLGAAHSDLHHYSLSFNDALIKYKPSVFTRGEFNRLNLGHHLNVSRCSGSSL